MPLPIAFLYLVGNAPLQTQMPTAAQVLARVRHAYDSVRTFEEDVRGAIGDQKGTAHISFSRPGRLRVTGESMFHSNYDLVVNGKSCWVLNAGAWSEVQGPEMGVATITGISANAGTLVPALLLHTQWGGLAGVQAERTAVARERIGGRDTLRLRSQGGAMPMTLWVDAKTYFLVRTSVPVMGRTIRVEFAPPVVGRSIPSSRFVRPQK